jgi:N6-adenosine-specific RNA methylase IME4
MKLVLYDSACLALAKATAVDEVKEIRDQAEAMRHYGRQAKNRQLESDAWAVRERAEIRLGEIIAAQKKTVGLAKGGGTGANQFRAASSKKEPAAPTLAEAGIDKKLSARAQKKAALSKPEQDRLIREGQKAIVEAADKASALIVKGGDQKSHRAGREAELAAKIEALPFKRYGVILADPEWRLEPYSRETGLNRAADNHYPTSSTEEIAARDIPSIAAENCVLFLWATVPMLPEALHVMAAWGFQYRSHCVWVKDRMGTGYWFRNKHELLLVGVRGDVPAPAPGTQATSVIEAPIGRHSEKPEAALAMIEKYFPSLPKIELNRRGPARKGWDAWGQEAI